VTSLPRLYVFTISHYSEKARWACDRKGMPYRLITLLPGAHLLTVRRLAPKSHVPLLIHGSQVIQDSSGIIDYLDATYPERPLTPADTAAAAEVRGWESWLDRELGETARRLYYFHALQDPSFLAGEYLRGGPRWGSWFYALALSPIRRAVAQMYDVTAASAERDLERLKAAFARLDGHLAARRFLVGERFSRADLTLAALAGGILRPLQHPAEQYPSRGTLPGWLEQTRPLRESATAERVRELYRTERRATPGA
jgi:glutathione S-transferase